MSIEQIDCGVREYWNSSGLQDDLDGLLSNEILWDKRLNVITEILIKASNGPNIAALPPTWQCAYVRDSRYNPFSLFQ